MNRIEWKQKAVKQLLRLPPLWQVRIRDAVGALREFPDTPNVKVLRGHSVSHRLRVGRYRVLFEFDGRIKIVTIEEVKKRDAHTY
ncbi:MAG: type II toxin-antitoxin system RelE/ParE family toxin [Gammaproteobacteria bacterium]|nr:type II toxin-antitoxin system RelE/ParE family toxin [Gammaproteobacteria bacterium]